MIAMGSAFSQTSAVMKRDLKPPSTKCAESAKCPGFSETFWNFLVDPVCTFLSPGGPHTHGLANVNLLRKSCNIDDTRWTSLPFFLESYFMIFHVWRLWTERRVCFIGGTLDTRGGCQKVQGPQGWDPRKWRGSVPSLRVISKHSGRSHTHTVCK